MKPARNTRSDLDWPGDAGVVSDVVAKIREKARVVDARRTLRLRRARAAVAAFGVVLAVAGWGIPFLRDTESIATITAGRKSVTLRDGSLAELNAHTRVRTDFRWGHRRVRLNAGEAFFSVAKDPAHPFLVETPHGTIRVTGTQFNVRIAANETAEVTLIEGGIAFEDTQGEAVELVPGQQLRAASGEVAVRQLRSGAMDSVVAWREGRLVFDGLTLGEAAERLAAFHGCEIVVAAEIAGLRADGSIGIESLAGALDALQVVLPIRVLGSGGTGYRIVAR